MQDCGIVIFVDAHNTLLSRCRRYKKIEIEIFGRESDGGQPQTIEGIDAKMSRDFSQKLSLADDSLQYQNHPLR